MIGLGAVAAAAGTGATPSTGATYHQPTGEPAVTTQPGAMRIDPREAAFETEHSPATQVPAVSNRSTSSEGLQRPAALGFGESPDMDSGEIYVRYPDYHMQLGGSVASEGLAHEQLVYQQHYLFHLEGDALSPTEPPTLR